MQCPALLVSVWNDGYRRCTNVRGTITERSGIINGNTITIFNTATLWVCRCEIYGVGAECGYYFVGGNLLSWGKLFELVSL